MPWSGSAAAALGRMRFEGQIYAHPRAAYNLASSNGFPGRYGTYASVYGLVRQGV